MRESILLIALGLLLACLGLKSAESGCLMERPYEEGVLLVACRDGQNLMASGASYWYEHPRLVPFAVYGLELAVGGRIARLRLVWTCFFLISFALACLCVRPTSLGPRRVSTAVRFLLVFTVFSSPLILGSAVRLGPGAISYLATGACILSGIKLIATKRLLPACSLGASAAGLIMSHVYGCVAVLGMLAPLMVYAIVGKNRKFINLCCLAVIPSLLLFLAEWDLFARLWQTTRDHYWAEPLLGEGPLPLPLARLWYPLTQFAFDAPLIPAIGQLGVLLLLLRVLSRGADDVSRWLAASALLSIALFWIAQVIAGRPVVVHHWLGWLAILAICAIARGLCLPTVAAVTVAGAGLILIPALLSIGLPAGRGEEAIKRASAFVERELGPSDRLVIGGSRAYMSIMPNLDKSFQDKGILYLRVSHPRDSFPGQNLVPPRLRVTSESWHTFEWDRAIVVQFDAAQRVLVPSEGAVVEDHHEYVSNSVAIDQITVEIRRRSRDPL